MSPAHSGTAATVIKRAARYIRLPEYEARRRERDARTLRHNQTIAQTAFDPFDSLRAAKAHDVFIEYAEV